MSDDKKPNQNQESVPDDQAEAVNPGETVEPQKAIEKSDASSDGKLHDPQVTSPSRHDEQAFGGEMAALDSDDDIDQVGEEYGVEYAENEELDVAKKVPVTTVPEPPATEEDSQE
jgi:hypothetical protein